MKIFETDKLQWPEIRILPRAKFTASSVKHCSFNLTIKMVILTGTSCTFF